VSFAFHALKRPEPKFACALTFPRDVVAFSVAGSDREPPRRVTSLEVLELG
jgi:hypothetical protein